MSAEVINKRAVADVVWLGVPDGCPRSAAWQVLLGYLPLASQRQHSALKQKRQLYAEMRARLYGVSAQERECLQMSSTHSNGAASDGCGEDDLLSLEQIRRDLPRLAVCTATEDACRIRIQAVLEDARVVSMLERLLFVWAVRQPSPGYVQGLLDVALPLLLVFLSEAGHTHVTVFDVTFLDSMSEQVLQDVEADCYWCLARLLSELMDNYTEGQPGIQRSAAMVSSLFVVQEPDFSIVDMLEEHGLQIHLLLTRWLGCLMVRETSLSLCLRLWDTLLAEVAMSQLAGGSPQEGLSPFLACLCGAILLEAPQSLSEAGMDELMQFAQRPALGGLSEGELAALISEAYVLLSSSYAPALEQCSHREAQAETRSCDGSSTTAPESTVQSSPPSEGLDEVEVTFPSMAGFVRI